MSDFRVRGGGEGRFRMSDFRVNAKMAILSAGTSNFQNLSTVDSHPGNTPNVRKKPRGIRAKRERIPADWMTAKVDGN